MKISIYTLKKLKQLGLINDFYYIKSKDQFIIKFSINDTWITLDCHKDAMFKSNTHAVFIASYRNFINDGDGLKYLLDNKAIINPKVKDGILTYSFKIIDSDIFTVTRIMPKIELDMFGEERIILEYFISSFMDSLKKIINIYGGKP